MVKVSSLILSKLSQNRSFLDSGVSADLVGSPSPLRRRNTSAILLPTSLRFLETLEVC